MKHTSKPGVLGKDGAPYAPATLFVVSKKTGYQMPYAYTPQAVMAAFLNEDVSKIILITEENVEHTVVK
jgi:hypothetical protein|tara:strand:+ start:3579 stop:3785 length:207 start_codon:yes stop_codon:yes gene_type:complete